MAHSVHREIEVLLPRLRSFACYLTRDPSDADDLVQASIEMGLRKLNRFTPGTNLKAWLCTIMRNLHVNESRRRSRWGVTIDIKDYDEHFAVAASQDGALEMRDFVRAYGNLPAVHKRVIDLVGIEGYTYQEAAVMLHVPVGTVRSRLSRAREHLSEQLDGDVPDTVTVPMRHVSHIQ
jgi:RNA polymerase sigma-70 factor (ECF subfamily)